MHLPHRDIHRHRRRPHGPHPRRRADGDGGAPGLRAAQDSGPPAGDREPVRRPVGSTSPRPPHLPSRTKLGILPRDIAGNDFVEVIKEHNLTIYAACYAGAGCNTTHIIEGVNHLKVAYLIVFDDTKGHFNLEKANKFGVLAGPDYGRLKRGEPVQAEDGSWVQPNQVIDEPIKGKTVLILHSNSPEALRNVARARQLVGSLDYVFWMNTTHTMDSDALRGTTTMRCDEPLTRELDYVALTTACYLNEIHVAYAPQLFQSVLSRGYNASDYCWGLNHFRKVEVDTSLFLPPLSRLILSPPDKVEVLMDESCYRSKQPSFKVGGEWHTFIPLQLEDESARMPPFDEKLAAEPYIAFLGTGCSSPAPLRNVSGILLRVTDDFAVLLDAGEGTLHQIYCLSRSFDSFVQTICSIRLVFISHSHADHHMGLYSILALRRRYAQLKGDRRRPVVVVTKRNLRWMSFYNEHISRIQYDFVEARGADGHPASVCVDGLRLECFEVEHVPDSFGAILTHRLIGRIVYSGDTRPCPSLEAAATGCDVLIQEASFSDYDHEQALQRGHTTYSEAVNLAAKCRVGVVLLTHFSQRYKTIDVDLPTGHGNVIVAYDLMRIPLKAIGAIVGPLEKINDHLQTMFNDLSD
ncbi:tRNA 3'-trailer sequence RNase, putative [Babesia caballi]|uniref:ribonuclease Z n=1 Tax=Babesia caballi TaxID=5871 RepID=A0AAV4LYL9_BABCB|nr:tRNA 3'-trailer sequence RNase, putative [Babesia caballi]